MKRVAPSVKTKSAIQRLLEGGSEDSSPLTDLVLLSVQSMVEEALEGSVRDLLGREYYARREDQEGSRNGYRIGRLKTGEGEVRYSAPQVRDVDSAPLREIQNLVKGRTEALEQLAIEMYARGCSTRDIEAIFQTEDGRSLLSRTSVSEVTETLWEEYEAFATRDLSDLKPLYLFLDGIAERLRPGAKREAVLCAWALTWEGKKVLIHLAPGTKESTECCRDFLEDLKRRGLEDPILFVTDGAAGLIRAGEECFPSALRQRCLAHKMRNLASKLPDTLRAEFQKAARAAYQAPSLAMAKILREDLVERYANECPTATRCFEEDFDACIAHLHCPASHHKVIRTTNLLERLFREERRRVKAVGNFFGERPVLKLMYAAVIRASDTWRGLSLTEFELGQLTKLHEQRTKRHKEDNAPAVKASDKDLNPRRVYSKNRT